MKKQSKIRIGVIGLGQIALRAHLPGYSNAPGCRITAVYSSREDHAKQVAAQYGIPQIYRDWQNLLKADQVDAVSICTPNFTHMPIALKALQEGKHVLLEKPMAMSKAEGLRIAHAAKKHGKILMIHHNMRFDPAVRTVEKMLRKKIIGDIFGFKATLTHKGPADWSPQGKWFFDKHQSGGGALMDLGPHLFDTLAFLLGDRLQLVGALAHQPLGPPKATEEIHCSCLVKGQSGSVGTMTVGWADTDYYNRFYFYGAKGSMFLNLAKGEPITLAFRNKEGRTHPSLDPSCFSPTLYEHFLDCIRKGRTPSVSAEEGLRTLELIEAGYSFIRQKNIAAF